MTSPPPPILDEFGLIARHLAPLATHKGADGLRDDVAILAAGSFDGDLVINTDAVVSGVHFLETENPALIAERVLRVNLSDLAAKGAKPLGYQLTLALPSVVDDAWMASFAAGLRANQAAFNWSLLGGDTVRSPGPLTISVTAFGTVPHAKALRRGGAQIGDEIWVTGWIGDGALGLAIAKGHDLSLPTGIAAAAEQKFRLPQPRIAFGVALAESGLATASADVSDGLIADLGHIASASALGMAIEAASVPLSDAGRLMTERDAEWLPRLLTGGDDYEVIFTAPPLAAQQLAAMAEATRTPLCRIGHTIAGTEVVVTLPNGDALPMLTSGYTHF